MKILVLGASGMLGSTIFRFLSTMSQWQVFGTVRDKSMINFFSDTLSDNMISDCDVTDVERLKQVMTQVNPDIVINCIGVIKQVREANDPEKMIIINSLLPHRLSIITAEYNARLIHFSTDCVFSGNKGNYLETDVADAQDIYGRSKLLGEVNRTHCITLRTSIIGHELQTRNSLVEWFLSQDDKCDGYINAIFSGLPTIILAQLIADIIIPNNELNGVYHVSSEPISKYDLLKLISKTYDKKIEIRPSAELVINRSLCSDKFHGITGYKTPEWSEMIEAMHANR